MDEIIANLFHARDIAHAIHLRTRSFAQHVALGDFYKQVIDLADDLAETFAGRYSTLNVQMNKYPTPFTDTDAVTFIRSVADWADKARASFNPADTLLLNQWDELLALINKTKYKLENLH